MISCAIDMRGRCSHDLMCRRHETIDLASLQSPVGARRGFAGTYVRLYSVCDTMVQVDRVSAMVGLMW